MTAASPLEHPAVMSTLHEETVAVVPDVVWTVSHLRADSRNGE